MPDNVKENKQELMYYVQLNILLFLCVFGIKKQICGHNSADRIIADKYLSMLAQLFFSFHRIVTCQSQGPNLRWGEVRTLGLCRSSRRGTLPRHPR